MATPVLTSKPAATSSMVSFAMAALCGLVGWSLATVAFDQLLKFGPDTPYVSHLLALDAPATSELGEVLGPAGGSVDNFLLVAGLVAVAVAASLLIVATWLWLSPRSADRTQITKRVTNVGLWIAVVLALTAFLPIEGTWQQLGLGQFGTGEWNTVATRVLLLSVTALLLQQAANPQLRPSLRGTSVTSWLQSRS